MTFDYSEITPGPEAARAAHARMAEGLAAEAVNRLRARLLERWPSAAELRWTRAPGDDGVLRHGILLDARGRLLASGEEFAIPFPFRGMTVVLHLEPHSTRIGDAEPARWSLDLTFERQRHPGDRR